MPQVTQEAQPVGREFDLQLGAPYFTDEDPLVCKVRWTVTANHGLAVITEWERDDRGRVVRLVVTDREAAMRLMLESIVETNLTGPDGQPIPVRLLERHVPPLGLAGLLEQWVQDAWALTNQGN